MVVIIRFYFAFFIHEEALSNDWACVRQLHWIIDSANYYFINARSKTVIFWGKFTYLVQLWPMNAAAIAPVLLQA